MAIRLNLLAEAQALEDLRRRDPVKRAVGIGVLLVLMMALWSSWLWARGMVIKSSLNGLETNVNSRTNEYSQVLDNQKNLKTIALKLASLQQLATNRFLNGNMLNALQHATAENVQLTKLKVEQAYIVTEGTKPTTNGTRVVAGKPTTITEKTTLVLDARDSSPAPGDAVNKFKDTMAGADYFQTALEKASEVRLKELGAPMNPPDAKPYLMFTLECRYPEKTR